MDLTFDLTSAFGMDPTELDFDLTGFVPASKATDGIESERYLLPRVYEGTLNGRSSTSTRWTWWTASGLSPE